MKAKVAIWLDMLRTYAFGRVLQIQLLYAMVPGLLMTALWLNSNIKRLGSIALVHQAGDSWVPIGNALRFVRSHTDLAGLYHTTYFSTNEQFIYAPQGLAICDALDRLTGFSFGDVEQAKIASWWLLVALTAYAYVFFLWLARELRVAVATVDQKLFVLAVAVCSVYLFFPLTGGYTVGNIQNFLTALVAIAMFCFMRGRSVAAGFLLGIAVLVKPHIGVMLVWALVRRDWRFAGGMIAALAAGSLLSLSMYGWPVHAAYLELLQYLSGRGESYAGSHTFESALYRLMHLGNNVSFDAWHRTLQPVAWIHWTATALGLATMVWAFWARKGDAPVQRMLDFGSAYMAIVIASPVAYEHHFGLSYLLLPATALLMVVNAAQDRAARIALPLAYLCLANIFPVTDGLADTDLNLLQSYRLIGTLLLIFTMIRIRPLASGSVASGVQEARPSQPALA